VSDNIREARVVIASLSFSELETYLNLKFAGTKKVAEIRKILDSMTTADLSKLAMAMADEYKTNFYWSNLEYHFDRIFIHKDKD